MNDLYEQNRERMQNAQNDEAIKDIRQAQQNLRGIIATLQALGDLEKCKKLMDVEQFVDAYLKIAEAYAAEGAKLALADINLEGLEKLKKSLKKADVYVEKVDITDAKACKKFICYQSFSVTQPKFQKILLFFYKNT